MPLSPFFAKALSQLPATYGKTTKGTYRKAAAMRTCEVAMNNLKISEIKDCLELEAAANVKIEAIDVSGSLSNKLCRERQKISDK